MDVLSSHPLHVFPHDLQGLARAVVCGDSVRPVPQEGHGDGLREARVSHSVLHPVARRVHGELPIRDHRPEALHHHGGGGVTAAWTRVLGEDRLPILLALPVSLQHLCCPPAKRDRSIGSRGFETPYSVGEYGY